MKRFISLFLMFSFLQVHAALPISHAKALSSALDRLNYSLTVEWDQKDEDFYKEQQLIFKNTLKELRAKGMSNTEMVNLVAKKMKKQNMVKEMTELLSVIKFNQLSTSEAQAYIMASLNDQYAQGASWIGTSGAPHFGIAVIVILVIVMLTYDTSGSSYNGSTPSDCYDEYVCHDYYDYYFGWINDCAWESVCYYIN